jgi:sterol desaturase/sphingolipid hydroxylase (fatty acid hydroxylase superfamily)
VTWEVASPALIVTGAFVIAALERTFPYERQPILREGFWTDLVGYGLLQSYVLALLIGSLIRGIDAGQGLSRLGLVSAWPVGLQVAFFVVTHDLYIYAFHRWQHKSPVLWRLHEAHHSNTTIDWLAAARSHSLEILLNQTIEFAPMVFLGAAPEVPLIKGALSAVWGLWIHSNVDVRTGKLQWVLNGPEAHRWHHAVDTDARDRNFGTKLAFWDRLFGSAWLPPRTRRPLGYGLTDEPTFPRGYLRQHAFAFRALPKAAPAGVRTGLRAAPPPGAEGEPARAR